jgi:hypothetical protein
MLSSIYAFYCMGKQCRSRSASTSMPSDQVISFSLFVRNNLMNLKAHSLYVPSDLDLHCLLFHLLGYFWPKSKQCRSWSHGTNVPADMDLHCSLMRKNAYIWSKGLVNGNAVFQTDICVFQPNSVDGDGTGPVIQEVIDPSSPMLAHNYSRPAPVNGAQEVKNTTASQMSTTTQNYSQPLSVKSGATVSTSQSQGLVVSKQPTSKSQVSKYIKTLLMRISHGSFKRWS